MALSALKVRNATKGRHGDGAGLYLLVSDSGAKSWVLRIQVGKRRRDIGLGSLSDLTLAEARDKARELRKAARAGADPIAVRDKRSVTPLTFKEAAKACHEARAPGWSERHAKSFLANLELHAFPKIGSLHVDSVDEKHIVSVLMPLWSAKPSAARALRQRLGIVLDFAKGNGWRAIGAPRDGLRPLLPKLARGGNFAAMPYAEVPAFVAELKTARQIPARLALLFTILTAARSGETRKAMWSHVDLDAREWRRPAEVMKSRVPHVVTLSPQVIEVLTFMQGLRTCTDDCLIFPNRSGQVLSDPTVCKFAAAKGVTVHGFRASFRTWAAEQMPGTPEAVAESALAHQISSQVVRAYQRAKFMEMRRELLDAWGQYVAGTSGQLVQMPQQAGAV